MKEQTMIRATSQSRAGAGFALMLALLAALLSQPARAQQGEAAVLKRSAELRATPAETGRVLQSLPAQEPVTRLPDRQGAWIQVQTRTGVAGWVHMFDVGPAGLGAGVGTSAPTGSNPVAGGLRGLTNLIRGPSSAPPRTATSTIGIRGLEAEDLARAQPNLPAVAQMERLRQGEAGAREFAADALLAAALVPALAAPQRQRSPQSGPAYDPGQQQ